MYVPYDYQALLRLLVATLDVLQILVKCAQEMMPGGIVQIGV